MGMLIPSGDDKDIVKKLNKRFNEKNLKKLRKFQSRTGDRIFAPGRSLRRISKRLKLWPTHSPGDRPRARWFKFLMTYLPKSVQEDIRDRLDEALLDTSLHFVVFHVQPAPDVAHRLIPSIAYSDDQTTIGRDMTLQVPNAMPQNDSGDYTDPPPEAGEPGMDPEDPDDDTPAMKGGKTKKPGKKAAKKVAKKVAKKRTTKTASKKKSGRKKSGKSRQK